MFEYYRKKDKTSLCYKIVAERVRDGNWNSDDKDSAIEHYHNTYVVVQTGSFDPWFIPTKQFLEEWEGVEDKDLPPAYKRINTHT
jgi:hypothetical protein